MSTHQTIFISDLHLQESSSTTTYKLLQLLKNLDPARVDALYILGDLFEAWIGDDDKTALHQSVIHALKDTTQKSIPIYFLPGNRDFLIGKKFLQETGCLLLNDETIINLYNVPVLLMHGDTLCTQDDAYLKARKKLRNKLLQKLFLLLPLSLRRKIADQLRIKSKQHTSMASLQIMDVAQDEVLAVMQKHQVLHLIHGHTHRPNIHSFPIQHQVAERIVLGAWHDGGNMLIWDEVGNKKLVDF